MDRRHFLRTLAVGTGTGLGGLAVAYSGFSDLFGGPKTRDGQTLVGMTPAKRDPSWWESFEQWLGVTNATLITYASLGVPDERIEWFVNRPFSRIWNRGHVPHVIWQPYVEEAEETPGSVPRDIADGKHDDRLSTWVDALRNWLGVQGADEDTGVLSGLSDSLDLASSSESEGPPERRIYLNFAPEMNGDWVPWGAAVGDSTPADFVEMWRHVHDTVMGDGITNDHVQWIWAPNHAGRDDNPIRSYYPGDDYVDWIGLHGYNWHTWGGWSSPSDIYGGMLHLLREIADKPIVLSEVGCSSEVEDGHDPAKKAQWIGQLFDFVADRDIRMVCWFNVEKETDWAVFGSQRGTDTWAHDGTSYEVYSAYRDAIRHDRVLPAHPSHSRVLTNREFKGDF